MVEEILTTAGFVEGKTFTESRFLTPPKTTYAVYNDSIERRGGDNINLLSQHDITLELYEYKPDSEAEKALEAQLDINGLEYAKESRFWIQQEQIYQVVYDFSYYEKGGI